MAVGGTIRGESELHFSWLIKLRWSSIVGQIATILGVYFLLEIEVPLRPLFTVIGLELVSNIAAALWFRGGERRPVFEWHLAAVMALDIGLLTAMLYFTGGPSNPFSFLYLVNIALAAVVLHAQWTWMLVALALLSFGLLPILEPWRLPLGHLTPDQVVAVQQQGMWVAFGVASGFIVHFLWRVTGALTERERELAEARRMAAQRERVASLATMAAGAAHELATPLGTIAVVAKELERGMGEADAAALDDVRLIREQVGRCRLILDQMAGGAGNTAAESIESVTIGDIFADATTGIRERPAIVLELDEAAAAEVVEVPPRALAQAIRSLLTNAQDASTGDDPVELRAHRRGAKVEIEVQDRGGGMTEAILARIGEPFFTTKEPGKGMGLGLFLTRAVIEGLGGSLAIDSRPGAGTRVVATIPANPRQPAEHPSSTDASLSALHPDR